MILNKLFGFEAAHHLPFHEGQCKYVHGHSYKLRVAVAVEVDPKTGMGCDFAELEAVVGEHVLSKADHRNLNDFLDNPTAENICRWIWDSLHGPIPGDLVEIELHETDDSSCLYRGPTAGGA